MLKAEQFVKSKDWRSVLEYTKKYLDTGRYNQLISYFHHWHFIIQDSFLIIYWIIHKTGSQGTLLPVEQ